MAKIQQNDGYMVVAISNDETKKLRARRIMLKDGCAYNKNGKCIAGSPWSFQGWKMTLWSADGEKRYSWTTKNGAKANYYHFKTKKDVLAAISTVWHGIFSEAAAELSVKPKK